MHFVWRLAPIVLFVVGLSATASKPQNPLDLFAAGFDPRGAHRVGIEAEFTGISVDTAVNAVRDAVGGRAKRIDVPWHVTYLEPASGRILETDIVYRKGKVRDSRLGEILIEPEPNSTGPRRTLEEIQKEILELKTAPLALNMVADLQLALDYLVRAGAIGTREDLAVSLQVNVEIGAGRSENFDAQMLVNLLRLYVLPTPRAAIETRLQIPPIRQPYILPLAPGFLARLQDPDYRPTLEQLKDDYLYRQMVEFLEDREIAWSRSPEWLRERVLRHIREDDAFNNRMSPLFRVIKFNPLKLASLLLFAFPDDPLRAIVEESHWINIIPAVEFRDRNNDFDVERAVRESVGAVQAAERMTCVRAVIQ